MKVLCSLWILLILVSFTVGQRDDVISLQSSASIRGLVIGTAAPIRYLRDEIDQGLYSQFVKKHFQLLTPEDDLIAHRMWFGENLYNWTETDWLLGAPNQTVGWAEKNHLRIRGAPLLWANDQTIPQWLIQQESNISAEQAKNLLQSYLHAVINRYRKKIARWVIVNEAVDDHPSTDRPFDLRDNFWYRKLGKDYIKYAFIFARQADSQLKLYYNDYNAEGLNRKSDQIYKLIKWLRDDRVPIDGIGFQWHVDVSLEMKFGDGHYSNAQRFIDLGLEMMITELDIAIPMNGLQPRQPNDLHKQGLLYRAVVQYALHFSVHCRALTLWGFTDRYSWIPYHSKWQDGMALPFDWMYQPKFALQQIQEELTKVLPDGIYRIAPQLHPTSCLEAKEMFGYNAVNIRERDCQGFNQTWNVTWQTDGTYRISPLNRQDYALDVFSHQEAIAGIQIYHWWKADNQRWMLSPMHDGKYRLAPYSVWWRALTFRNPYGVILTDYHFGDDQHWIFKKI